MTWGSGDSGRPWGGAGWARGELVSNEELKKQLDDMNSKIERAFVGLEGLREERRVLMSEIADITRSLGGLSDDPREVKQLVASVLDKLEEVRVPMSEIADITRILDGLSDDLREVKQLVASAQAGTPPPPPEPHESPTPSSGASSPWEPPPQQQQGGGFGQPQQSFGR